LQKKSVTIVTVLIAVAFLSGTLASSYAITPASRPAPTPPTLHTQILSETIPGQQLTTSLVLTFNLTGHDVGSDSLNLIFGQNSRGTTNGFPSIVLGLNSTEFAYCSSNDCWTPITHGSISLPFVPKFVVSCGGDIASSSNSVSCAQTIHYSPLTESQLRLMFLIATSGDSASLMGGTHTWTVTTIS
jgi:hypothetical protein